MGGNLAGRLVDASMFGIAIGFASQFGSDIWRDPIKRNYAVMAVVGVILLWIVVLHGGARKI